MQSDREEGVEEGKIVLQKSKRPRQDRELENFQPHQEYGRFFESKSSEDESDPFSKLGKIEELFETEILRTRRRVSACLGRLDLLYQDRDEAGLLPRPHNALKEPLEKLWTHIQSFANNEGCTREILSSALYDFKNSIPNRPQKKRIKLQQQQPNCLQGTFNYFWGWLFTSPVETFVAGVDAQQQKAPQDQESKELNYLISCSQALAGQVERGLSKLSVNHIDSYRSALYKN